METFKSKSKLHPLSEHMSVKPVKHKVTGLHSFEKLKKEEEEKKMELTPEEIGRILAEPIALRISPLLE